MGDRIKALRMEKGLKQEELAKESGITLSVLARYEQGNILDINPWILEKIAVSLKVAPLDILPPQIKPRNGDYWGYFSPAGTLGGRIRQYRLSRHIQQKELARMLHVDRESIRRYEKGLSKPDKNILIKLEEILKSEL